MDFSPAALLLLFPETEVVTAGHSWCQSASQTRKKQEERTKEVRREDGLEKQSLVVGPRPRRQPGFRARFRWSSPRFKRYAGLQGSRRRPFQVAVELDDLGDGDGGHKAGLDLVVAGFDPSEVFQPHSTLGSLSLSFFVASDTGFGSGREMAWPSRIQYPDLQIDLEVVPGLVVVALSH